MNHSYQDPAKQLSREKLREFIRRNLLYKVKDPKDIQVACFPGEELLEVTEVYDKLGIPRVNVYGIERDRKVAESLRNNGGGIQVVNADALDFFSTTDQTFDVISLDYTGKRGLRERQTLERIAGGQLLRDRCVLTTNHFGKRESKADSDRYIQLLGVENTPLLVPDEVLDNLETLSFNLDNVQAIYDRIIGKSPNKMERLRNNLTDDTISILRAGTINLVAPAFLKDSTYYDGVMQALRVWWKEIIDNPEIGPKFALGVKSGLIEEDFVAKTLEDPSRLKATFVRKQSEGYVRFLTDKGFSKPAASAITLLKLFNSLLGYYPEDVERYKYISSSGAPMYLDIMYLDQHREILKMNERVLHSIKGIDIGRLRNVLSIRNSLESRLRRPARSTVGAMKNEGKFKDGNRVFLGSSFVPPKRKERINKEDARILLEAGFKPAEIAEVYSGFTKMQLAAFKAHMTMGTYEKAGVE